MTPEVAQSYAFEAMKRHWGSGRPEPIPAGGSEAYLFTAQGPDGPSVIKVWADPTRALRQARRQKQAARAMAAGRFRVPAVHFFDPELQVLAMQRAPGRDLAALWREGAAKVPEAASGWVAAYHGLTRRSCAFDPTGQVNWLKRLIEAGETGRRKIPDLTGFRTSALRVSGMASSVVGSSTQRAVTHRDMTLSNLVLSEDGTVWGLDLENPREDEPLRDVFTLALDLMTLGPHAGAAPLPRLLDSYGDSGTDPEVRLFLQGCFCLWVWANTPMRPSARQLRRIEAAEQLLKLDEPII